jgi:RNA polymerase sigma-70 factor (family 1)
MFSRDEPLLVKELSEGNILAFNTLFKEYSRRLYRFAIGYLKSEEESEELVQEVFTIIWERRTSLKEELSFKSFLFTIAFNIIRKHFRTKMQMIEYFRMEIREDLDTHTISEITYNSIHQYITKLVNQLPERRKLIFIKSRFEGLSTREISEELKISHKTVENQLTDALKFLRANLSREGALLLFFFIFFS